MAFITWNDSYSVNVAEIDEQHKQLINLANRMYDAMRAGKGKEALGPVLSELLNYTAYHFSAEESLLERYSYPDLEEHHQLHELATEKVRELRAELDSGNTSLAIEVMMFLSNWLNVHILEVDRKYGAFLNEIGVR